MISERLTNFLKLHFPEQSKRLNKSLKVDFFNVKTKSDDKATEKKREKRIFLLAIFSGFIVSLAIKANLIEILQTPDNGTLGWDNRAIWDYSFYDAIKILIGCLLTALFISTGSKFWHDLLDLLLFAKNKKEKLAQEIGSSSETPRKWLDDHSEEIAESVLKEHIDSLLENQKVLSVGIGVAKDGSKFIQIASEKGAKGIPNHLTYMLPNGREYKVPVEHIESGEINTQVRAMDKVANYTNTKFHGSFGCRVKFKGDPDSKYMFLTNYHAVIGSNMSYSRMYYTDSNQAKVVLPDDKNRVIGTIQFGIRNYLIDAALVNPVEGVEFFNTFPGGVISGARNLLEEEIREEVPVRVFGAITRGTSGMIRVYKTTALLKYHRTNIDPESNWRLYDLFTISNNNEKSVTKHGDSGAAVIDGQNRIVGIVVGGSDKQTYAIHIHQILDELNLEIT